MTARRVLIIDDEPHINLDAGADLTFGKDWLGHVPTSRTWLSTGSWLARAGHAGPYSPRSL